MNAATTWLLRKPHASRVTVLAVAAVFAAGLVAAACTHVTFVPLAGGFTGCVLVAVCYLTWATVLSDDLRRRTNLKQRLPLTKRRYAVFVVAVLWLIALLLAGKYLPLAVAGTLNVAVVIALVVLFRPSPDERAVALRERADNQTGQA